MNFVQDWEIVYLTHGSLVEEEVLAVAQPQPQDKQQAAVRVGVVAMPKA
jgi:hypothetical protein